MRQGGLGMRQKEGYETGRRLRLRLRQGKTRPVSTMAHAQGLMV